MSSRRCRTTVCRMGFTHTVEAIKSLHVPAFWAYSRVISLPYLRLISRTRNGDLGWLPLFHSRPKDSPAWESLHRLPHRIPDSRSAVLILSDLWVHHPAVVEPVRGFATPLPTSVSVRLYTLPGSYPCGAQPLLTLEGSSLSSPRLEGRFD